MVWNAPEGGHAMVWNAPEGGHAMVWNAPEGGHAMVEARLSVSRMQGRRKGAVAWCCFLLLLAAAACIGQWPGATHRLTGVGRRWDGGGAEGKVLERGVGRGA